MTRCILHRYKYKDLAKSLILGAAESLKVWKRLEAEYSMTDTRALADGSSIVEFQPKKKYIRIVGLTAYG